MPSFAPPLPMRARVALIAALTCIAFVILGYHPYAEDGGIYLTALLQRLHPAFYPQGHEFAYAHLHHSFYLWLLATIGRLVPHSLMGMLFAIHGISLFATLWMLLEIATRLFVTQAERISGVAAAAVSLSLPVAGTALYLADPYVTARSISTPLLLLALIFLLDGRYVRTTMTVALALLLHPLMALWGTLLLFAVAATRTQRKGFWLGIFCATTLVLLAALYILSPSEDVLAQTLAASRSYWFLSQWHVYEWIGIAAPLLLLCVIAHKTEGRESDLARAIAVVFAVSVVVSLLFVHIHTNHLLLARMQPLRMFHLGYLLFILMFGAAAGRVGSNKPVARSLICGSALLVAAAALFCVQRSLYASSHHLELPGRTAVNPWQQAFLWIRDNTPEHALFAMDAHYITSPGEDAASFRAVSQRSVLPDYSKDGGVASVYLSLAPAWQQGEAMQESLDLLNDAERMKRLNNSGTTWIVLRGDAHTTFLCPYSNAAVKVCSLPHSQ